MFIFSLEANHLELTINYFINKLVNNNPEKVVDGAILIGAKLIPEACRLRPRYHDSETGITTCVSAR